MKNWGSTEKKRMEQGEGSEEVLIVEGIDSHVLRKDFTEAQLRLIVSHLLPFFAPINSPYRGKSAPQHMLKFMYTLQHDTLTPQSTHPQPAISDVYR